MRRYDEAEIARDGDVIRLELISSCARMHRHRRRVLRSTSGAQRSTAINLHHRPRTAASPSLVEADDAHTPDIDATNRPRAQQACGAARAALAAEADQRLALHN